MESAISSCPYEPRQSSSLTTGTSAFIMTLARLPPSEVVPHPETVQVVPAVYSSPSDGSIILSMTELLNQLSSQVPEDRCHWRWSRSHIVHGASPWQQQCLPDQDHLHRGDGFQHGHRACWHFVHHSSDHHVILDQRSSTHQRPSNTSTQQSNLVGEFSSISFSSSNNPSASSAQRGGESLLGELGGSGGNSHDSEEDCSSHDQALQ